jgi:hypothetical protein
MASANFYEIACRTAQAAEVRALMTELLELARDRERLLAEFGEQVLANRTRREGKPPKISKAGKQWQREAEADARKAADGQAERIAKLSDEQLLRQALNGWDTAVQFHNPTVYHEDDRPFAVRIDRHNRQALRRVKSFFRRRGLPIPALGSGGGISFNVAFQRDIPDLGKLGADSMTIEPALAALDQIAQKANLSPLSEFVNPDPEGLSGAKPEWFDPAAGLATVLGLLEKLGRSARAVKNGKKVGEGLRSLESDLVQAEQHRVRFHFVMLD